MHRERRESAGVLVFFIMTYLIMWLRGRESYPLLYFDAALLLVWIFYPRILRPLSFLFQKAVLALTFLTTLLLVAFVYYFLFMLFKPVLYFSDKRFYRKRSQREETYYSAADNKWRDETEELF